MAPEPAARRRRGALAGVALFYGAVSVALLHPLATHLTSHVATGDGTGDSYEYLWDLWWMKVALLSAQNPFHTKLLFWPQDTSLLFHALSSANGILTVPFQLLFPGTPGLVASLNLLVLASFAMTGLAVYLLARDAGASAFGALAGGLLALTLPYRVWHLNHLNVLSIHWGLFTLLFVQRTLRNGRAGDAVAAACAAAFTTYADFEIAATTGLAAAGLVLAALRRARAGAEAGRTLARLGACAGLALALHLPLLWLLLRQRADWPVMPDPREAEMLSANLVGLILPGPHSLLHRSAWASFGRGHGLVGDEVYVGTLFLLGLALLCLRRRTRLPWTWLMLGGVFLVLALGPSLHVGSLTVARSRMPYEWLRALLPLVAVGRSPVRLVEMADCCLAVAMAVLLEPAPGSMRDGGTGTLGAPLGTAALVLALVAERWPARAPEIDPAAVPRVYVDLARDPDVYAIMPVPITYYHRQAYMFWQTVHGRPITTGWTSRWTHESRRWLGAVLAERDPASRAAMLERANVRYVILHPSDPHQLMNGDARISLIPPAEWRR